MNKRGITFIEILVAISVIIILITVSISSFYLLRKKTAVDITAKNIVSTLRFAKNKTLASQNSSSWGVHFDSSQNQFTLFQGESFNQLASNNEITKLPSDAVISSISLDPGGIDVVFNRLDGATEESGQIEISSSRGPKEIKTIFISSLGEVNTEETPPPLDSRQIDSRHIHFNLGWSIQNSSLLTLNFPGMPEVTENIDMLPYFNANKTEFNLERSIPVNGETQKLRIHTHLLDATNTILSVHRDRRENNKPLEISIDGKTIVSYSADGEATIGVYGGTMEIQ